MFTWSMLPLNRSHVACLFGPTTTADRTSALSRCSTSTGSPKRNGTETSPPPKSSTDTGACGRENTWKVRTYKPSRPVGRYRVMFNGEVIKRARLLSGPAEACGIRPILAAPPAINKRPGEQGVGGHRPQVAGSEPAGGRRQ